MSMEVLAAIFMKNLPMNIEQLGFNSWFFGRIDPTKLIDHQIARVIVLLTRSIRRPNFTFVFE
jgi:hypothetical protein